jgi:hypothetical protein
MAKITVQKEDKHSDSLNVALLLKLERLLTQILTLTKL